MRIFLILAVVALPNAVLAAPSFNCRGAESTAEFTICTSDRLGLLDRALADRYAATTRSDDGRMGPTLEAEQRDWQMTRDACGPDHWCIEAAYLDRLRQLRP